MTLMLYLNLSQFIYHVLYSGGANAIYTIYHLLFKQSASHKLKRPPSLPNAREGKRAIASSVLNV